ncbi:hypothetical protein DPMN_073823 [Dreissena polymorpha]|uniref:Uncharacterized protein n=1 Tax=Dreissena polymorpha TaxID=45954 RepID=A0A9D4BZQ0_DREPO|nr:hypothetical protein DPMN_073823 [Dreissena polymorpha]
MNVKVRPIYTDKCEGRDWRKAYCQPPCLVNSRLLEDFFLDANCILYVLWHLTGPLPNSGRHASALHPVKEMEPKQPDHI